MRVVSYTRLSVCRVRLHISLYIWPFQSCIYTSDSPSRSSTYFVFYSKHLNRRFIVGGVPYILTFHLHYLFGMSIKICLTFCRGLCVKSFSVEHSKIVDCHVFIIDRALQSNQRRRWNFGSFFTPTTFSWSCSSVLKKWGHAQEFVVLFVVVLLVVGCLRLRVVLLFLPIRVGIVAAHTDKSTGGCWGN